MKIVFRREQMEVVPQRPASRRVAIEGRNHPDTIASVLGAMEAGAEIVLQNIRLTPRERDAQLASIEGVAPAGGPGTILFTSGTTGAPKAALLALDNHLASARAANAVLGVDASSRFVCALPLFHVGGVAIVFRSLLSGATLHLHERFDEGAMARDLLEGATHVSLVAGTLARLLDRAPRFPPAIAVIGGGAVPLALLDRARSAGLRVLQTYGLTETASMVTCERLDEADGATAGRSLPGFEVRVDAGEILVRGAAVMRGYLGQEPLRGWFRTGDLGDLDERGRLIIHARRTDLIVSGGENVYPAEVEAALLSHPGVREAAVVPASDEKWGQVGVAYVAGAAGESELREFLQPRLARYKIPARFITLSELPRTAAGKVDRLKLLADPRTSPARP